MGAAVSGPQRDLRQKLRKPSETMEGVTKESRPFSSTRRSGKNRMHSIWEFQIYIKTEAIIIPFLRLEKEVKSYQNLDFTLTSFYFEYPKEGGVYFRVSICVTRQRVISATRYNELNFLDVRLL